MSSRGFDEKDRAALDVLLRQYDFLRAEITQSIYLEHAVILALYTTLGLIFAVLFSDSTIIEKDQIDFKDPPFLFALVVLQVIISSFGSLFLKEQARNRRACSFLKATEHLINEKIGEIGIYWENYITSELIARKINRIEYINFNLPVNRQYYKNRLLGVGLPVFLPNILITLAIGHELFSSNSERILLLIILAIGVTFHAYYKENELITHDRKKLDFVSISRLFKEYHLIPLVSMLIVLCLGKDHLLLSTLFVISILVTFLWALMIIYKSGFPLKEENLPNKQEVLRWLEKEQSEILFKSMPSIFTIKNNLVELEIHVVKKDYSGVIYDVEIFPEDQDPPWESIECVENDGSPVTWECENEGNGLKFLTRSDPLKKCKPVKFRFNVILPNKSIKSIRVHLTDKNGENIGEIISKLSISTFTIKDEIVEMEVHEVRDEFSGKISFIEIFPEDQDPPWESIECVGIMGSSTGWKCKKEGTGVKFLTKSNPLIKCESIEFQFKIQSEKLPRHIRLHLIDQNKNPLDEVISIPKKNPP